MTLYARHEPASDIATRAMMKAQGTPDEKPQDVVLYYDAEATRHAGTIQWYSTSKPDRRNKWQMLNCVRYRLVWI
jgi:hypothetical protein